MTTPHYNVTFLFKPTKGINIMSWPKKIGKEVATFRHGHNCRGKRSTEYEIWAGLKSRCLNKKNKLYPYYGGRGIKVCSRWLDFNNFISDMGFRPKDKTLDRIDNSMGYNKENCRWASKAEQSRNKRNNININIDGKILCLKDAALLYGVRYKTAWRRFRDGWPIERVLSNG